MKISKHSLELTNIKVVKPKWWHQVKKWEITYEFKHKTVNKIKD